MEIITDSPTPEECVSLVLQFTGYKVEPQAANELWPKILQHKWVLSEKLGRDVGTKISCLDFMENIEPMDQKAHDSEKIQGFGKPFPNLNHRKK
jgi:hypothetical protein